VRVVFQGERRHWGGALFFGFWRLAALLGKPSDKLASSRLWPAFSGALFAPLRAKASMGLALLGFGFLWVLRSLGVLACLGTLSWLPRKWIYMAIKCREIHLPMTPDRGLGQRLAALPLRRKRLAAVGLGGGFFGAAPSAQHPRKKRTDSEAIGTPFLAHVRLKLSATPGGRRRLQLPITRRVPAVFFRLRHPTPPQQVSFAGQGRIQGASVALYVAERPHSLPGERHEGSMLPMG